MRLKLRWSHAMLNKITIIIDSNYCRATPHFAAAKVSHFSIGSIG